MLNRTDRHKPVIFVHPGWGKRPKMLKKLMFNLADAGMNPIGVDTRFGYSDRLQKNGYHFETRVAKLLWQSYRTSGSNPFFETQSEWDNRYRLRRPIGLAAICLELGIREASLFGHSEGARIVTTLAAESDLLDVPKLVVANAVGTGDCSRGVRRMLRSNTQTNYVLDGTIDLAQGTLSALESTAYMVTHLRRSKREREVIQKANIRPMLDNVAADGTAVTVLHARNDKLIEFEDSAAAAASRPHIDFIPTDGGHSNVYTDAVTELIVKVLAA